ALDSFVLSTATQSFGITPEPSLGSNSHHDHDVTRAFRFADKCTSLVIAQPVLQLPIARGGAYQLRREPGRPQFIVMGAFCMSSVGIVEAPYSSSHTHCLTDRFNRGAAPGEICRVEECCRLNEKRTSNQSQKNKA